MRKFGKRYLEKSLGLSMGRVKDFLLSDFWLQEPSLFTRKELYLNG